MKQPERVAELLAELRTLTENDFERHRIDVLERDLHEPPTVEIIDETHQKFDGVIYPINGAGHFAKSYNPIHREVWKYYFGEIPEGYEIHHVDDDKSNNKPENLQCLTKTEHRKLHFSKPELIADLQRELTCDYCGKKFVAVWSGGNRFCSDECKSARFYRCEHNQEERICAFCGVTFKTSKFNNTRCCSHSCAMKLRLNEKTVEATCPIYGKKFMRAESSNKIYCSRTCASKAQAQKRRETRICAFCGKPFETWKYTKTACCSKSCAMKKLFNRKPPNS